MQMPSNSTLPPSLPPRVQLSNDLPACGQTDCEADVDTDHDESSSQQSGASSPRRLEGGQWLV